MQPDKKKVSDFLSTLKVPKTPKQIRRFIGFFQYFRAFIPKLGEKLLPFYKLLRQENETVLTSDHHKRIDELRKNLEQACDLSLRLPTPNAQYVILTDASFYAAGYVLMIEDDITDQAGKTYKTRSKFLWLQDLYTNVPEIVYIHQRVFSSSFCFREFC